jgi:hypothetical protein
MYGKETASAGTAGTWNVVRLTSPGNTRRWGHRTAANRCSSAAKPCASCAVSARLDLCLGPVGTCSQMVRRVESPAGQSTRREVNRHVDHAATGRRRVRGQVLCLLSTITRYHDSQTLRRRGVAAHRETRDHPQTLREGSDVAAFGEVVDPGLGQDRLVSVVGEAVVEVTEWSGGVARMRVGPLQAGIDAHGSQ